MAFLHAIDADDKSMDLVFTVRAGTDAMHVDVKASIRIGESIERIARTLTSCSAQAEELLLKNKQDRLDSYFERPPATANPS